MNKNFMAFLDFHVFPTRLTCKNPQNRTEVAPKLVARGEAQKTPPTMLLPGFSRWHACFKMPLASIGQILIIPCWCLTANVSLIFLQPQEERIVFQPSCFRGELLSFGGVNIGSTHPVTVANEGLVRAPHTKTVTTQVVTASGVDPT